MTVSLFITVDGPPEVGPEARTWAKGPLAEALRHDALSLDLFTAAAPADDPYTDDGVGPLVMLQADFAHLAALDASDLDAALWKRPVDCTAWADAFEGMATPVHGERAARARSAPVSYVVRYHRPAEDRRVVIEVVAQEGGLVLGRLPGVRNVLCYLSLDWFPPVGAAASDCMLGNEVVFDSLEDLDAALNSSVRDELRQDYNALPPFSGKVTHHAMARRRL